MPIPDWVTALPSINAGLNALATLLLIGGYLLIRGGRRIAHRNTMLTAFATSIAFLTCYLTYHAALVHYTGDGSKHYPVDAPGRTLYLSLLASHVVLAVTVPVLASITIYRGLTRQWERHRRIAKVTFPIWLYVSVTGVIIYVMLYHWAGR